MSRSTKVNFLSNDNYDQKFNNSNNENLTPDIITNTEALTVHQRIAQTKYLYKINTHIIFKIIL